MECPFCSPLVRGNGRQGIVLENERCFFIREEQEILAGSGCIIPKAHRETVFELSPQEWQASFELLGQVKALLDREHAPDGYNIGWNCGRAGGQSVFHAHMHVIPRFSDEPYAGRGMRSWIKRQENQRPGPA
jgi:diadenosine tetraphosphate (Ap4A) HIT family hydrolase